MPKPAAMRATWRPIAAVADDEQVPAAELALLEAVAPVPVAAAHRLVGADRTLGGGEHQHHRVLGDRDRVDVADDGERDAARR